MLSVQLMTGFMQEVNSAHFTVHMAPDRSSGIHGVCLIVCAWVPKAGRVSRNREISGGRPPRNDYFSTTFFLTRLKNFHFPTFSKKWPKSEETLNFRGMWVWVPIHPSPNPNFVAAPLPDW